MPRYELVSGSVFSIVALAQLTRAVLALPAQVGGVTVPVWLSFVGFAIAGSLAIWAFRRSQGTS